MDDLEHPVLGVFKPQGEEGWIGRSSPGADFFDLFVMRCDDEQTPRAAALATIVEAVARMGKLKGEAVEVVCAARESRLGWRRGPPADQWSVVEMRIDVGGALWLMLHEYETDEYSRWMVKPGANPVVRRIPALALYGAPDDAGERV